MANALVIDQTRRPTRGFVNLAHATGRFWAIAKPSDAEVYLQVRESTRVYEWFAQLQKNHPLLQPAKMGTH